MEQRSIGFVTEAGQIYHTTWQLFQALVIAKMNEFYLFQIEQLGTRGVGVTDPIIKRYDKTNIG